jgi:tetratricopeptide (TPR) repeat protein
MNVALASLVALLEAAPRFQNSGAPEAQPAFLRGVTALHSFAYEDAVAAFQEAQRRDPGFALAYWGEAMACNQTLWLNQDLEKAREILNRLGPTPSARSQKAPTDRERGYLQAVELLFGSGDKSARDTAYAEAMGRLAAAHPEDLEAATFHALALLGTTARSPALFRSGGDDLHQHALVGSAVQQHVAAILRKVLARDPSHPGALHYLIHDFDDPAHARLALEAARAYARLDPQSSHALHMPAHVFVQLGLWHEAAASDEASFRASQAWVTRKGLGVGMRDYHSLSWLHYESLQLGRYRKAREALVLMATAVDATGAPRFKALQSEMRARYVLETRSYAELASANDFATTAELFAIGFSAARLGDASRAERALAELERRAGSRAAGEIQSDAAVMAKELAAVVALGAGRRDDAVRILQEAVALERELPPPMGPPRPMLPASELSGEILLELGRPREAATAFERSLGLWPNRSRSLLGRARAALALGDRESARIRLRSLLDNWRGADPDLPELPEARRAGATR